MSDEDRRFIKDDCSVNQYTGEMQSRNIINPHNFGMGELTRYSLYEDVMAALTEKVQLYSYKYSRIDIRLDSFKENYLDYYKLNGLLVGLFSMAYKFKNDEPTESAGQMTRFKCGLCIKNQSMTIDYYDKKKESQDRFPCKARLEFRALKLEAGNTPADVVNQWFKRFDKLDSYYELLQDKCNYRLYEYYLRWLEQNRSKKSERDMLTLFLRENQNTIYTMRQLEKFCRMCEVRNPASRAKNIKHTCGIEFFSLSDVRTYIDKIKKSITYYMEH